MPYDFHWHDDQHTVIRLDARGESTWEQFHEAITMVTVELAQTAHRIDVIVNDTRGAMPKGSPLPHIKSTAQRLTKYPQMGKIIVVSNQTMNNLMQAMVRMVFRIYGIDTRIVGAFVNSIEEADQAIAADRAQVG